MKYQFEKLHLAFFPKFLQIFRCSLNIFKILGGKNNFNARLEIISDVVSEKARSGKIPIPHRKLFLTVWEFEFPDKKI